MMVANIPSQSTGVGYSAVEGDLISGGSVVWQVLAIGVCYVAGQAAGRSPAAVAEEVPTAAVAVVQAVPIAAEAAPIDFVEVPTADSEGGIAVEDMARLCIELVGLGSPVEEPAPSILADCSKTSVGLYTV